MDQEIFSALVNSSHESILTTDYSGKILFCNKSSEILLNSTSEILLSENIFSILAKDDVKEIKRIIRLLSEDGKNGLTYLARFINSNNDRPLKVEIKKLKVKKSRQILFVITPHTKEEEEAHKLYKLLAENAYDINIMFEGDELIYVSPSIKDFLGYEVDEIDSSEAWNSLIYEEDFKEYDELLKTDRRNKVPFSYYTYRQRHKDGRYRWFETKIRREFKEDGLVVEMATSVDITQRKKFELELEMQKEFIEQLFDTDPNLIFVRDGNGRMIYCNKAVAELVGKSREEFLSIEYNMFPASDGQIEKYLKMEEKVINNGEEILIEEQIPDSNGILNYFQTIKKPLKTQQGDVNMLSISTNINKIKYYEKEAQNVMKARNEFFSAMSHEIRTPMNAILGMTELLLRRKPRKDQSKLLETLHFSSKNLLSLINDVLDFSKIEAGKIEIEEVNFNIKELVENVMVSLRPKAFDKNINVINHLSDRVPEVINGDYIKLSQILNNLLSNAIKFTSEGSINIDIDLIHQTNSGFTLKFDITDTGIGIAKEKIKNIFDPFHQANKSTARLYGGTGLGLSIVQNLVEMQNGTISVASKEGKGSTFTVILPFKTADTSSPVNSLPSTRISDFKWKMNLKVLYVEDVTTNQFLIEEILSDWGIKVEMASDGYEALEMIESKNYDLILMDIQMPGIDGLETTRQIRSRADSYYKNIPILALTASTTESTKDEIFLSGMQDFILKPIHVDDLRAKIVEYSNLIDEFKDMKIVDDEQEIEETDTKIIFDRTDKLFLGNLVRYQEFLRMTIEEFKINLDLLKVSILDNDLMKYRQLRHRMKSMIATFGMKELLKLMDDIKAKLLKGSLSKKDQKAYNTALDYHVNFLIDSLSNKLASLKWQ
ncbi:MAG: PAS domain S-box protein [Cytophagales bacterium]|nr:PAS domain S-box protein [Cytophagales bacterium]